MKTTAKRSLSRLAGQYSYILVFVAVFLVWALTSSSLTWSGAMSYTVIDKIIVALKMDSLINDAIKGVILILVILIQVAGPRLKAKFGRR